MIRKECTDKNHVASDCEIPAGTPTVGRHAGMNNVVPHQMDLVFQVSGAGTHREGLGGITTLSRSRNKNISQTAL